MPLFIKGPTVDALAHDPASLTRGTETEAVRQASRGALACETDDLVAQPTAFARRLREQAGPNPQPVDQAFLNGLYGGS
ncbi:transcription factor [Methylobacterium terrae]|uniref:Transcription factor n=1 Tax=Methylobacterium terrae TaxID=2202827 RepID=A0A2U8WQN3_9HYPH|nr:type II toxin-antitoxin system VapB family antitoxin [Methylobacterium terrae]AWN48437.1 transcription factor [Methylobacterium terrae]